MRRYLTWWPLYCLCAMAAMVLIPPAIAMVWITRLVARMQDHADMQLLRAGAAIKNNR